MMWPFEPRSVSLGDLKVKNSSQGYICSACRKPRNIDPAHIYKARGWARLFWFGWMGAATQREKITFTKARRSNEISAHAACRHAGISVLKPKVTQYPHVLESRRLGRINYIRRPAQEEIPYSGCSALLRSHHSSPGFSLTLWSIRIYKHQRVSCSRLSSLSFG